MRRSRVQISLWALFFGARFLGTEDRNLAVQDRYGERANELKRARGACLACLPALSLFREGLKHFIGNRNGGSETRPPAVVCQGRERGKERTAREGSQVERVGGVVERGRRG